jgi:hypothetical protein
MDLFRLTYNGNPDERLIFAVLAEIIKSYKRYLGKWPDFLERTRTKKTETHGWVGTF